MVPATRVANVLLALAHEHGDVVTNLKLQKLLYYAQAWYLVNFGKRLFKDPIQAWDLGPVVPDVYHAWKKYQSAPIPYRVKGNEESFFQQHQISFLTDFFEVFSSLSATELVSMSHAEKPWKEAHARGNNSEIDPKRMRDYYTEQYKAQHGEN